MATSDTTKPASLDIANKAAWDDTELTKAFERAVENYIAKSLIPI
jgi:hypothetical protein